MSAAAADPARAMPSVPPSSAGHAADPRESDCPLAPKFASLPPSAHPRRWDDLYRAAETPWDRAGPSLALADLLSDRPDLVPRAYPLPALAASGDAAAASAAPAAQAGSGPRRATALVPGCGRGHDVLLLAAYGYDVWGLDCSAAGLRLAEENCRAAEDQGLYRAVSEEVGKGSITWLEADFFAHDWSRGIGAGGSGQFDLVFDYTFFCALPPESRPLWAKRIAQLVHPKGRLVCLEFPSGKSLADPGPPWGVTPEVYETLLSAPGDPCSYAADGAVITTASSKPSDGALHRLSIIKPTRTHRAGTADDGSVKDFISVWMR